MKKLLLLALAPLAFITGVHAAPVGDSGVTESTDPAKAEAVERHADALAARDAKLAAAKAKAAESRHHHPHGHATSTRTASR
jgi:hypothetical protein